MPLPLARDHTGSLQDGSHTPAVDEYAIYVSYVPRDVLVSLIVHVIHN